MVEKTELLEAVYEATERLNWAMSAAADAGILIGVNVDDDPLRTAQATPYPKITVEVLSGRE